MSNDPLEQSNDSMAKYDYYCPNCDEVVKPDAVECNLCGYPIAEKGGPKQVKKPIKFPELPYQALSTKGKIWYILMGKYYKFFTFKQKVICNIIIYSLVILTVFGSRLYSVFQEQIIPLFDDDVYWVEKLDGTTEYINIPDGCGPIIEKMVNNEPVTEAEILKLRETVPHDDAVLLFEGLKVSWYKEHGWDDTVGMRLLLIADLYNFNTIVYPQQ